MKEKFLRIFTSNILIRVTGKNINNFIKKLIRNNIDIIKVKNITSNELELMIKYNDLEQVLKYKTIYEISIKKYYGWIFLIKFIKKNIYIFIFIVMGLILLCFLSNIIFRVEVIHSNKNIINLVKNELEGYGIKKYSFVKSYEEIENIEERILEKNKDKLEWMEIVRSGTKYTVRLEERLTNSKTKDDKIYDIISSKNAIIKKINATKGEKNRLINTYVKKGEVVISSSINLPNNEKKLIGADGNVVGEVWYNVHIDMPYHYHEVLYTGKRKNVIVFSVINKKIPLFNFHQYKTFDKDIKVIFENRVSPVSLYKEYQYETVITDIIYSKEEAKDIAIKKVKEKLKENNKNIIDITKVIIRTETSNKKKISLDLFVTSLEDITEYKEVITSAEEG